MTPKAIEKYTRKAQKKLRLDHWDITIEFNEEKVEDGAFAKNISYFQYKKAWIYYSPSEIEISTDDFIKKSIIHELLHCHHKFYAPFYTALEDDVIDEIAKLWESEEVEETTVIVLTKMYGLLQAYRSSIMLNEETSVELLARAIYILMEWKDGRI